MDQTAFANQALLWNFGERRANANMDRHQRVRAGGDHQEATQTGFVFAYLATDFVVDALRETTVATSSCGNRTREQ